jgi:hypothetical protein
MSTLTRSTMPAKANEPAIPLSDAERKLVEQIASQRGNVTQPASRIARRLLSAPLLIY